jgi:hypothetical protein
MNNPTYSTMLDRWCRAADTSEKQLLADACGSTYAYVTYHLAKGRREPDATLAARIETATRLIARGTGGRLFTVYRTELNTACRECVFAQRCLGDKAIAAEFPLV